MESQTKYLRPRECFSLARFPIDNEKWRPEGQLSHRQLPAAQGPDS